MINLVYPLAFPEIRPFTSLAALYRQKKHTYLVGGRIFNDPRYDQPWVDERAFRGQL
jgi:hypothetical protein